MDVVTLGESMVLFVPHSEGPLRFAGTFEKSIGGAESNVMIALARLGHQTGWIGRVGDDEFGLFVRHFIRGEGVDTSRVAFDPAHPTAVFFKERKASQDPSIYFYRKGSAASAMTPEDLDEAYIAQAKYLHLTGILPALSPSCRAATYRALAIARRNGLTTVFDPNIRLKLWSKEEARTVLLDIASQCDIVLPGLDEGEILTGSAEPSQIASRLLENGARMVVVKLGEKGAYFASSTEAFFVEGFLVERIVDTAGAGDGFAAGFLSGLLRGWPVREAVKLGNLVGAFALTVAGDVEGYPYWAQIDPQRAKQILR